MSGKKLLLKWRPDVTKKRLLKALSKDGSFSLGGGPGSADDPVEQGGSLRVVSASGDGFDHRYPLPTSNWTYLKKKKPEKGYKFKQGDAIKTVLVKAGKQIKIIGKSTALGHSLMTDPQPVHVELRLGAQRYCMTFGGSVTYTADKKYLAKSAPTAAACPGSPSGAFVD